MNTDGEQLAFIVGHYKSGSTWLINMLSLHPDIRGLAETNIFKISQKYDTETCADRLFTIGAWARGGLKNLPRHRLADWVRPVRNYWKPTHHPEDRPNTRLDLTLRQQWILWRKLRSATSPEDQCRRFFQYLFSQYKPREYLIEKTPTNIEFVPDIKSLFPTAKLIAVYRDGRDVVVSDKFFSKDIARRDWTLENSARTWRELMEKQLEYSDAYQVYCVSYEDLLQNSHKALKDLLGFLDLPHDRDTIEDLVRRSSFRYTTGRQSGVEGRTFYRKGISGDWMNHLDDREKDVFKKSLETC